MKNRIRTVK